MEDTSHIQEIFMFMREENTNDLNPGDLIESMTHIVF